MNTKELKKRKSKITVFFVLVLLIVMFNFTTKSIAENVSNIPVVTEMKVTSSLDNTIEITKVWDDEGNNSQRPTSVTYTLYKEGDRNNAVATLTLNNSNAIDEYTWKGTFENIPQKDSNNQDISYVVCEENIDKYISIADKTVSTANNSEIDTSAGIKFKFNPNTKMALEGRYLSMFDSNAGLKLYAYDVNNEQWYGLDQNEYYANYTESGYIFKDSKIRDTLYEIKIDNMTPLNSKPTLHAYVDTGDVNEIIGLNFPETKHPLAIGDNTLFTYKVSPKSSIIWYFDINMVSWGGRLGNENRRYSKHG